jgi:hypothetical protein
MNDSYHLDLSQITLVQYGQTLKAAELIPSRRFLQEDVARRFAQLREAGIDTLEELLAAVKNKARLAELAERTGLDQHYLTVLRREVGSLLPSPRNLRDFPGVDTGIVEKLAERGCKNTKQLFDRARSRTGRAELAAECGIDDEELLELLQLSDLSRLYGVGPVFARLLYNAGIDSVQAIAASASGRLFEQLAAAYLAAGNPRVDFTERDLAFCIQMAARLPAGIEP